MPRRKKINIDSVTGEEIAFDNGVGMVDVHVGAKICARRKLLQISQKQMAEKLGITFQQVQKYEKGVNRIGAGRLYSIAKILGVNVEYFYDELVPAAQPECLYTSGHASGCLCEDGTEFSLDTMQGTESLLLLKAFYALSPKTRQYLLMMISSLKEKESFGGEFQ